MSITYPPEMLPKADGPAEVIVVGESCGCDFCDCGDEPEMIDGKLWHVIDDDTYGNAGPIPCTKPVQ